jgi:hypothetical protein
MGSLPAIVNVSFYADQLAYFKIENDLNVNNPEFKKNLRKSCGNDPMMQQRH